jgi:peptidyl-prolyl cis-trans isomerase A (cyclophilin A)
MNVHCLSRRSLLGRASTAVAGLCVAATHSATLAQPQPKPPRVKLATSLGDVVLELDPAKAPKTVENFLRYVEDKHYDGLVFHRVIDGFMIQGGGFTPDMQQRATRAPIPLESRNGLKNERGTIAMARTAVPDSATSQFFINVVDNRMLDFPNPDGQGYAVFGRVVQGMDVVDRIRTVATNSRGPHQNVPATAVVINRATLEK